MKLKLDSLNDITGWVTTNSTITQVSWEEISKNYIDGQLQLYIDKNGYAYKEFDEPIDVSNYDCIVFGVCDFRSSVDFGFILHNDNESTEFIVEMNPNKSYYEFPVIYSQITGIEFKAYSKQLYTIIAGLYAFRDDFPYDLNEGLKEKIESIIRYESKLPILGLGSGSLGSSILYIEGNPSYVRKNANIRIDGDIYKVRDFKPKNSGYEITIGDGVGVGLLTKDYSGNLVEIYPLVLNNPKDIETNLSSVFISGDFAPEVINQYSNYKTEIYAKDTNGNLYERAARKGLSIYRPVVNGFFPSLEIKALLSRILRQLTGYNVFYFNGKRHLLNGTNYTESLFEDDKGNLQLTIEIHIEEYLWLKTIKALNSPSIKVTPAPMEM